MDSKLCCCDVVQRKQAIALADVEAHTKGKNPIANFRRYSLMEQSSAPAVAPLGAVPTPSPAAATATRKKAPNTQNAGASAAPHNLSMLPSPSHK
jgi:hypothetical protein